MKQFFDAIRGGDIAAVTALLDGDPSLVDARDENGVPALATAKYHGRADIANLLLSRGASLDVFLSAMIGNVERAKWWIAEEPGSATAISADGWTALHLSAFFNQPEVARVLIDAGADVNARSTNQSANTPLHAAVAGRASDVVRLLLERGAHVNARQHGGWTALHSVAQNGDTELARVLIAAGADVRARADNQQSALDLALTKGHQEMSQLLDEYGAGQ